VILSDTNPPSKTQLMLKLLLLTLSASVVIEVFDLLIFRYPSEFDIATELIENLVQVAVLFVFVNSYVTGPLLTEIKRRVAAEAELRKIEANTRTILEAMPDIILHISADGTIQNSTFEHETRFDFQPGQNITSKINAEYGPEVMEKISDALITGKLQVLEITNRTCPDVSYNECRFVKSGTHEVLVVIRDITSRKAFEDKLIHVSNHDALTDAYNRTFYEAELNRLAKSRRYPVGIIIIDLDGLKATNDTYGHAAGDRMIIKAAAVLQKSVRADDMVARIGGDEFAILLPEMNADGLLATQARIYTTLEEDNAVNDGFTLKFSLGSALAETKEKLLGSVRLADRNMYQDKAARKERSR
jgi:diguanylate cyclase (GGDEF)-like protein